MMEMYELWHTQTIKQVLETFGTHHTRGLSEKEALDLLAKYGPNELARHPRPGIWRKVLEQLSSFLVMFLLVASFISLLLGEYVDAGAIMTIVILNTILGVVQESRAEKALEALQKMAAPEAHVIREGHLRAIPTSQLVPGDLVLLEAGNYVPADMRLVESVNLRIEEASLTGESIPAEKEAEAILSERAPLGERRNMAYMGTVVSYGRGKGVIIATGMKTEIGRIAEILQTYEEEPTPLQVKLDRLGRWLGIVAIAICAIVFLSGVLRGQNVLEMFMAAISLAIAAVPEGLPAVVTICLALGMQRMAARHALIRKLPAVETLGSATVICSDKTGTLTQNEMTATHLYADGALFTITGQGYNPEGEFQRDGQRIDPTSYPAARLLLQAALLCSDARLEGDSSGWEMAGDPTEGALVVAAAKAGMWREEMEKVFPRVAEIPFDSERKRMTTIHEIRTPEICDARYVAYTKGAPDVVLGLCRYVMEDGTKLPLDEARRQEILEINSALTEDALRVLGLACKEIDNLSSKEEMESELVFLGLVGMIDPARPEVKEAIKVAEKAGLRTIMITGDYKNTAIAIARQLGLLRPDGLAFTGDELDELDEKGLTGVVEAVDVCARVSPRHKVMIIDALKAHDHVVAMTGDGVNDAPALKRADIGVAMGIAGTDVTKETADMVLTDDNYASIVSAIEEGRIIYSNIRKFVYYLLSCNVGEIMIIFLATLAGAPLPLTAVQILTLNLITDGAPALALGLERGEPDVMERPPRPPDEPVINRPMRQGIAIQSVAMTFATLSAFFLGLRLFRGQVAPARTMSFATLAFSELLRAYTARSEHYPIWRIGFFTNKYMQWAVALSLALLLSVVYVPFLNPVFETAPLSLREWAVIFPFILLPALAAEMGKLLGRS